MKYDVACKLDGSKFNHVTSSILRRELYNTVVLLIIFRAILEQNCSVEVGVGSRGENLLKNFNCDSCGMEINFNGIIRKFTFLIVWAQSIGRSVFPPQAIFFLNNPQIFLN